MIRCTMLKMELYIPNNQRHFQDLINQSGNGIGRYVFNRNMQGSGIASFFSKLLRAVIPVAKKGISTAAKIAKPHLQKIGGELLNAAQTEAVKHITKSRRKRQRIDKLDHE